MALGGVVELDLHGKNQYQAQIALDAALRRAKAGTYRLRVVHGSHGGTALRDLVRTQYAAHPKVRRVDASDPNVTILILREY